MSQTSFSSWLGAAPGSDLAQALQTRGETFAMIDAARTAVLTPADSGGLPVALRHGLAARVADLTGANALAQTFRDAAPDAHTDAPQAVLDFVDRVAAQTRDVDTADIDALRDAGTSESDIVRLCELVAFVAFQARVAIMVDRMGAQ